MSTRQYKIVAPTNPEKPIKYVRKPIDYSLLDDIGHSFINPAQKQKNRGSSQGSIQAANASVPPPTTKPPTPPQMGVRISGTGTLGKNMTMSNTGTLGKSNREYRTPPIIPPQVPSHYAPNYPIGHPRRTSGVERGPGYSSLPMQMTQNQMNQMIVQQQQPQQPQVSLFQ